MEQDNDPFRYHPSLRGRIAAPETSYWRSFRPALLDAHFAAMGFADWRYSDERIEAARQAYLGPMRGTDLWVFAYGSLMWDPGFRFTEVRRGRIEGHARRFCLYDARGGRGSPDAPGLMAALDDGPGCEGLAFRIAACDFDDETPILWRREMVGHAYRAIMVNVHTAHGPVCALTFAADHSAEVIRVDLTRAEQVRLLATGRGVLGTSLAYIETLLGQLHALGIEDEDVAGLLAEAQAERAATDL